MQSVERYFSVLEHTDKWKLSMVEMGDYLEIVMTDLTVFDGFLVFTGEKAVEFLSFWDNELKDWNNDNHLTSELTKNELLKRTYFQYFGLNHENPNR